MFEARDPGAQAVADPADGVRVRGDVGPARGRLLDGSAQLFDGELTVLERVRVRQDTSADAHLQLGRAAAERRARGSADLLGSVAHDRSVREAGDAVHVGMEGRPEVAVAAGLAQHGSGREQPRTSNEPAVDRLRQPAVGAADVAGGRESGVDHARGVAEDLRREDRGRNPAVGLPPHLGHREVRVRVDQTGEQRVTGEVDLRRARPRLAVETRDARPIDDDRRGASRCAGPVNQRSASKNQRLGGHRSQPCTRVGQRQRRRRPRAPVSVRR